MISNSSAARPSVSGAAISMTSTGTRVSSKKGRLSSPASGFRFLGRHAPRMACHGTLGGRWCRSRLHWVDRFAQTHLAIAVIDDSPFALLPEDLPLEPVDLVLGRRQFAAQFDDLLRPKRRRFINTKNTLGGRRSHAAIVPQDPLPMRVSIELCDAR